MAANKQGELFEQLGPGSEASHDGVLEFGDRRLPRRFWHKVIPNEETGCWEWCAAHNRKGYGHFGWNGRHHMAHRVSFTVLVGPIPEGKEVHHICVNPPCVRPDHLAAVTHLENMQASSSPIMKKAKQTHCKRGHAFTPENTFIRKLRGRRHRRCRRCQADAERERRARDPDATRERNRYYMRDLRRRKAAAKAAGKPFVDKRRKKLGGTASRGTRDTGES